MGKTKGKRRNKVILGISSVFLAAGLTALGFGLSPLLGSNLPTATTDFNAPQSEITQGKAGLESGALQTKPIDPAKGAPLSTNQVSRELASASRYYPYLMQDSDYESLYTEEAKALYQSILESVYEISSETNTKGYYSLKQIEMQGEISEDQIRIAITAFKNDNPQIFWIANVYSRAYSEDSTVVQLYSHVSVEECNRMIEQMNATLDKMVSSIPEGLSQLEREVFVFDQIANVCTYDTAAAQDSSLWRSYTSYGALVDGKAVCEGYARSLQQLLSYTGMKSRLVNGEAGGTIHMWNLVQVDGKWYHTDPTWNDEDNLVRYDYFNVNDRIIQKDHKPSVDVTTLPEEEVNEYLSTGQASYNLPLPACTSLDANYLKEKGVQIENFNKNTDTRVVNAFVEAAREKRPAVYLYIGEDINYPMAVSRIFQTEPYKLMEYISRANQKLEKGNQIVYEKITYILGENSRGITVKLTYA